MEALRENPRRMILIGLIFLVLICLVAYLIFNIFFGGGNDQGVGGPTPAATPVAGTEEPFATSVSEEPTLTPTRVLSEETVTVVPFEDETATPTPTAAKPTPTPTKKASAPTAPVVSSGQPQVGQIKNLLKNGDFEQGFDERGVALHWEPFRNDGFQAIYTNDTFPYIESGASAQRITILGATQYNSHAGIYQQVEVIPNEVYTLTLHGQIRTGLGDVNKSSFGYRTQYAMSNAALKNWQNVPEADWVELPWDEQLLNNSATKFYSYTTTLAPTSAKISLFVRAWNKWPDPGEVQYTFDSFSLVGPSVVTAPLQTSTGGTSATTVTTTTTTSGDVVIDKGLPTTGADNGNSLMQDGRFWGGLLILLLLSSGAVYRAKWGY